MEPTPAAPGAISTSGDADLGASVTYSVDELADALTYVWTVPADSSIESGQGTNEITVTIGGANGEVCVSYANECGVSPTTCTSVSVALPNGSVTFDYTGGSQSFTVPDNVTSITLEVWGAEGGAGGCCDAKKNQDDGGLGATPLEPWPSPQVRSSA